MTIRGLDPELERRIRRLAKREGISLNRAILRLLRRGAGLEGESTSTVIGSALDDVIGTWSDEEADGVLERVRVFESIDDELWR